MKLIFGTFLSSFIAAILFFSFSALAGHPGKATVGTQSQTQATQLLVKYGHDGGIWKRGQKRTFVQKNQVKGGSIHAPTGITASFYIPYKVFQIYTYRPAAEWSCSIPPNNKSIFNCIYTGGLPLIDGKFTTEITIGVNIVGGVAPGAAWGEHETCAKVYTTNTPNQIGGKSCQNIRVH